MSGLEVLGLGLGILGGMAVVGHWTNKVRKRIKQNQISSSTTTIAKRKPGGLTFESANTLATTYTNLQTDNNLTVRESFKIYGTLHQDNNLTMRNNLAAYATLQQSQIELTRTSMERSAQAYAIHAEDGRFFVQMTLLMASLFTVLAFYLGFFMAENKMLKTLQNQQLILSDGGHYGEYLGNDFIFAHMMEGLAKFSHATISGLLYIPTVCLTATSNFAKLLLFAASSIITFLISAVFAVAGLARTLFARSATAIWNLAKLLLFGASSIITFLISTVFAVAGLARTFFVRSATAIWNFVTLLLFGALSITTSLVSTVFTTLGLARTFFARSATTPVSNAETAAVIDTSTIPEKAPGMFSMVRLLFLRAGYAVSHLANFCYDYLLWPPTTAWITWRIIHGVLCLIGGCMIIHVLYKRTISLHGHPNGQRLYGVKGGRTPQDRQPSKPRIKDFHKAKHRL